MPKYLYKAQTTDGEETSGVVEAKNGYHAGLDIEERAKGMGKELERLRMNKMDKEGRALCYWCEQPLPSNPPEWPSEFCLTCHGITYEDELATRDVDEEDLPCHHCHLGHLEKRVAVYDLLGGKGDELIGWIFQNERELTWDFQPRKDIEGGIFYHSMQFISKVLARLNEDPHLGPDMR